MVYAAVSDGISFDTWAVHIPEYVTRSIIRILAYLDDDSPQ